MALGFEASGKARGLAKKVSSRDALSKVHWLVGRLELRQPSVIGEVGDFGKIRGVMVEVTEYEHGVLVKSDGVIEDMVHASYIFDTFSSDRVRSGKTIEVDERDWLFIITWVK